MGLTHSSTGRCAVDTGLLIAPIENRRVIALAGNPNVGKSTVFNALTGLHQHTGNWPGKTVASAQGSCTYQGQEYLLVDIPGSYSLMAHSAEEEVARDFICFGGAHATIVVCDATCLERNLNLVLQTLEITPNVVLCLNLLDEAKRKGIVHDIPALSRQLGIPIVPTCARTEQGVWELLEAVEGILNQPCEKSPYFPRYNQALEAAIAFLLPDTQKICGNLVPPRWLALRLLSNDQTLQAPLTAALGHNPFEDEHLLATRQQAYDRLAEKGIIAGDIPDLIVRCLVLTAEGIAAEVVSFGATPATQFDRKLDRILTSKATGFPLMLLLLCLVFWLTITGANYPSQLLSQGFAWLEGYLRQGLLALAAPSWVVGVLLDGVYRVLSWVVAVMLPPMAIFFPLFTLLEDLGYLPRVAFNLDTYFKKCSACGKQALTMAMGFGCNAAGVVGCRIIDSPRERLIAIITNNFVPCNGRFPTLIALLTIFFVGTTGGLGQSLLSAALLTALILFGILMTFLVSWLLSKTILKGVPSSFTLELPPYRRPQVGKIIVRSLVDRTLFVLGRAAAVAAPAGVLIWALGNLYWGDVSLLGHAAAFLDPFGRLLGMDGVILLAFILGLPANEIVLPIMLMCYLSTGSLVPVDNVAAVGEILIANGWTWVTALSVMLFSLMHWPCSTTCLTIHKETQSFRWTAIAFLVPTVAGVILCSTFAAIARLLL